LLVCKYGLDSFGGLFQIAPHSRQVDVVVAQIATILGDVWLGIKCATLVFQRFLQM
jgi:hypothetical protein